MRKRWGSHSASFARTIGVALLLSVPQLSVAMAAEPADWLDKSYPYVVVESDLRSVLDDFGRNTGAAIRVSDQVRGEVRGEIPALTARLFLDRLARDHGLVWYYDGFVVDISTRDELRTEVLDATGVSVSRLEREMQALEIYDGRFDIRGSDQTGLVFVSGPPRYLELVQQTLGRMRDIAARPVNVVRGSGSGGVARDLRLGAGGS